MQVINNITILSIVLTGAALIREPERGTIEHLLAMPVTPLVMPVLVVINLLSGSTTPMESMPG